MTWVTHSAFPIEKIRKDFPILQQTIRDKPLVYFDNAATTQKPKSVIDALVSHYQHNNANIHRGLHTLATRSTDAFEDTRQQIQRFIHAESETEIIFTRGVTESINLVASSWGTSLKEGDEIIISCMEHHSNIVPWQIAANKAKALLKIIPLTSTCDIDLEAYRKLLSDRTKLVAINHASNSIGTINSIHDVIQRAHQAGAVVLIDGAQATAHLPIDVCKLNCDFYCISAHKAYGPTGIGILYGKQTLLSKMPPYQGGGEMIKNVSFSKTTYNDLPYKFEAGTSNIADAIAWKQAIKYMQDLGLDQIQAHESALLQHATETLQQIDRIRIIGQPKDKVSVLSFVVDGAHPFDIGQWLDAYGIATRTGHHCTEPLMHQLGLEGTVRVSFSLYNTHEEIEYFVQCLQNIIRKLK